MEQTNNDCKFQNPHLDKFPTPATFACWKIRFKTEVCTCSQFPTEAMQWIKEVELVDSVDDLKSSCSVRGFQMPNFEVLDAKIASALNRIINNTKFKNQRTVCQPHCTSLPCVHHDTYAKHFVCLITVDIHDCQAERQIICFCWARDEIDIASTATCSMGGRIQHCGAGASF